eukprot:symbB.v1.2.022826.t1/scaffold2042.1/size196763/9
MGASQGWQRQSCPGVERPLLQSNGHVGVEISGQGCSVRRLQPAPVSLEILDLRANLDGLERERDYYFRKLRDVEILCLELKANMDPELKAEKVVEDVQGILYAENEVEAETDEANL